ncbi:MAG: flagellar hook-basal body complex protein FliE [candidate division Zixibacteria bacterium]|nr:flagellar hook-basal body complex protein FliE [candidate division Zixibacteria bacterium]
MAVVPVNITRVLPGLATPELTQSKAPSADGAGFGEVFSNLLNSVNELQHDSADIQKAFLAGEPVELHQVMIKAEEAGVAVDLLLEVRNKLLSAYTELIRMPV